MPPRVRLCANCASLPFRPRLANKISQSPAQASALQSRRAFADAAKDKGLQVSQDGKGPNTDQLPHVSEEAAVTGKITGGGGPDLSQGTPVEEMVKGDKKAEKNLPKVMREDLKAQNGGGKRSFSTMARRSFSTHTRRYQDIQSSAQNPSEGLSNELLASLSNAPAPAQGPPSDLMRLAREVALKEPKLQPYDYRERYTDIVDQFVGLLIKDGKKAKAQRFVTYILNFLRTSPPPTINPSRPLLPGHPPPSALPLNPVMYLTLAIDSVAPLMRIKNIKGAGGGGASLPVPIPMERRQRRRTAIKWILDAAEKRPNRGSGKNMFPHRVAEEIVAVVQGTSAIWDRRMGLHKTSVLARANVGRRIRPKRKSF